jgi:DNA-binding transcriptional ArsR family regulator
MTRRARHHLRLALIKFLLHQCSVVTFTALSDPKRRRIVELLATGEMAAGDINKHFRVSGPAISQHLKVLREAQLVRVRVDAQRRLYSLDPKGLDELEEWLTSIRKFWSHRLDALEKQLRAEPVSESGKPEPGKKRKS